MTGLCRGGTFLGYPQTGGGGPPYTDAQAVAAVGAFRDDRYLFSATPSSATGVYASFLLLDTASSGGPTASPGPLQGGLYSVTINVVAGGPTASAGSEVEFRLVVDAGLTFEIDGPFERVGLAEGRWGFSLAALIMPPLFPGDHIFDLQFRQPGGPGTVQALQGDIRIARNA